MKSMLFGSAIKPPCSYFSKQPIVPTVVASGNGSVDLSRVGECKTIGLEDSNIESRRRLNNHVRQVNYPQSTNKFHTRFLPQYRRKANFKASAESEAHSFQVGPENNGKSVGATFNVIYRYSKPYTLKGVVLFIFSICLLAVQRLTDITPSFFLGVMQAVIGGCLANSFVAGINQLSDIQIDKVNKPHLPLPSGELSVKNGVLITTLYALLGFCLGWSINSWPLKLNLLIWFGAGAAYSVNLPLLRWKRFPVLCALCACSIQGVILPMLFHLHAQIHIHGRPLLFSKHAIFVFGIMSVYSTVLAVFKDIPDVEGDKINGINTFASRFGSKRVFWICVWLLEMAYAVAILSGISSARVWIRLIMVIGHSILGFILWRNANLVDLNSNVAIESFYLFIWKLYYAELLLVPFLRF